MSAKTLLLCGVALLQVQSALALPVADAFPTLTLRPRGNITVDPEKDPIPIITQIEKLTEEGLEELIEEFGGHPDDNSDITRRQSASQVVDGALLTFTEGVGAEEGCESFMMNGPFESFHPLMGSSNVRALTATSVAGNTTFLGNDDDVVDPGLFTFASNERISKFSIGRHTDTSLKGVVSFKFETDAGQTYEALTQIVKDNAAVAVYEDLDVGSGIIARFTGSLCTTTFGDFGVDFLNDLDSISITNIDYEGFANNIMPTGRGTQLSVGSQILDNRNSSEKQTITLTTTDAITRQTTIVTQTSYIVGASLTVKATAKVPLISETDITSEAHWSLENMSNDQEMDNAVTTRAGTFALVCPPGKFCTAKAFFTQFKMDVNMNATFTATAKSGDTWDWVQGGTYKGADSLSMQFNVTEVDNIK